MFYRLGNVLSFAIWNWMFQSVSQYVDQRPAHCLLENFKKIIFIQEFRQKFNSSV